MDQIQSMRVFVRVVEAGNFTRAAESLGLPKGTVTKQIQSLEARLRTKLLNRTTRRVTVTPDGAAYYERTARLLHDFDDIESSMTNAQASPKGRLRVDVGSSTARLVILPALMAFCDQYPDIQIDLGVSDRPVDLIGDNVDVVIRAGDVLDQSLVARRIGTLPFVTVASPDYLKRHGTPQHPRDLEHRHRVVSFFAGNTRRVYPHQFHQDGEEIELSAPYRLSVNESTAHITAVLGGFGISQCVTFMAAPFLASGELVEVLPDWTRPPLPVHVVYPPNRHLSTKVRVFVDWAAELFAGHAQLRRG
jgi:LysR family transcriptional regulator, regulator for bpeEF and oprC